MSYTNLNPIASYYRQHDIHIQCDLSSLKERSLLSVNQVHEPLMKLLPHQSECLLQEAEQAEQAEQEQGQAEQAEQAEQKDG